MKKFKILLVLVLCLVSSFTLFACNGNDGPTTASVTIDGVVQTVDIGTKLSEPTTPTKSATVSEVYTFDGWYIVGTDTKWDFASDTVSSDVVLEARFITSARKYNVKIGDAPTTEIAYGSKLDKPADPIKAPNASTVYTFDGWYVKGTDTKWDFDNDVVTGVTVLEAKFDKATRYYNVTVGGQDLGDFAYGSYIEEPKTPAREDEGETSYIFEGWFIKDTETKWDFTSSKVNKDIELVAVFTPTVKKYSIVFNLTPSTITTNGKTYPLFVFNEAMASKYQFVVKDSDNNVVEGITIGADGVVDAKLPKGNYTYSLTAEYAITTETGSINVTANDNLELICPAIVQLNGYMGTGSGDSTYKYPSFGSNASVNKDSVIMTSHTYVFAGDGSLVTSMYIEADVTFPANRVGSMVGILGACEYGNISGESSLALQGAADVLRSKIAFSFSGGNKVYYQDMGGYGGGSVNAFISPDPTKYSVNNHKLAVLRRGNNYYIFIDGDYLGSHVCTNYNKGGFGLILTNPVNSGDYVTKSDNIRYITDEGVLAMMEKDIVGGVAINYSASDISVKQNGLEVGTSGACAGVEVEVSFKTPAGKTVTGYSVKANGVETDYIFKNGKIYFTPVIGKDYSVTVTFQDVTTTTLTVSAKPYAINVGGQSYALRDFDFDPQEVSVKLVSLSSGEETSFTLTDTTTTIDVESGIYTAYVTYKSNVYKDVCAVDANGDTVFDAYISNAYLGGSITLGGTTFKSYNNASETATSGANWSLVDGQRDTVKTTSHTYVFQKDFVGNKYYVEGYFDSTNTSYAYKSGFGGLMFAHGPNSLSDSSDVKLGATIYGDVIVLLNTSTWSATKAVYIANWKDHVATYDATSVKLGVLRDGTNYYFYVNDTYITSRTIASVSGDSGVGVYGIPASVTVSKFNYSDNANLLNALKDLAPSGEKSIDIYIISGQSNGSGYTSFNSSAMADKTSNAIYGYSHVWYSGRAQYSTNNNTAVGVNEFDWDLARVGQGRSTSHMGAEVGMAKVLSEYYNPTSGKIAGIIKMAHGGTSLLNNVGGENNCDGNWVSPSYADYLGIQHTGKTGGLYRRLLEQITIRVNELKAMGFTQINIKGFYWMQGESDVGQEANYLRAIKYFVSDVRRDIGTIVGEDLSTMPFLVGEISLTSGNATNRVSSNQTFINMQNTLDEEISNTYIMPSSKYDINKNVNGTNVAVGTDSWHWNMEDMYSIGQEIGRCIVDDILK
ncbi:MAG: InlB B-repeat-containing protein [Clostridia bacterium]|nr:InlB B-repeat-containing protein [Clostridia bacterium]